MNRRRGRALPFDEREWWIYRRRLGRQVRDARLERDIGRVELATKIRSTERTIIEIEDGSTRRPSIETLFRIVRGLGISLHEVLP